MTTSNRAQIVQSLQSQGVIIETASCAYDGLAKVAMCGADAGEGFLLRVRSDFVSHPALANATKATSLPDLKFAQCDGE